MFLALGVAPLHAGETEAKAETEAEDSGGIVVTGRRVSKADQSIGTDEVSNTVAVTREALLSAPSGVSGLKMLETLPGFNVQTDGALGLYEFGNSVQTRAFNLDQIGFILDGIPLGRSDAFGGSPVFRYVDNENLAVVKASVGAGDVSLPSYASLGPVVQYISIEPQDDLGLFVSQTFGEDDLKRTFIRFSTGQIGPVRAYISRTKLDSDLWRGAGSVDREHWEAQAHVDLGGDSWARFKFVSNNFFDYDSPSFGRATYLSDVPDAGGKTGRNRGYIGFLPDYPPTAAGIQYSDSRYSYYFGNAINVRKDKLFGATFHADIAPDVSAETTLYWENKDGYGVSPDTYSNSLGIYTPQAQAGLPVVAPRGLQYGLSGVGGDRIGITFKLQAEIGMHMLEAGIWAEQDKYHRTQKRLNNVNGAPDGAVIPDEVVYFRRDYRSKRDSTQLFVKDRISLFDDAVELELGVKSLSVDYQLNGYRDYRDYYLTVGGVGVPGYGPQNNSASYKDHFLPMAGLLYKLSDGRTQVFASYAENYALPKGMDDIYSVTLASSAGVVPQPEPEKSQNFELGVRTSQPEFYAALALYYTKFDNRIQSTSSILPGTTNVLETFFVNVGGVEAYGAEFTGSYRPEFLNGLAYFNTNITYNHAKFEDDIPGGAQIGGKFLPDSAKWIVNGGITIEPASWLVANFSGKYTSKRWSTFANTPGSTVPAYTVFSSYVDIGDGYSLGPLKGIKARVNVDNVFDKDVLSFMFPQISGDGFFRPLSPRTFQFTISAEY
ncbi:TonB-dependent receptor domain-containing protein [Parasphingorhabdus sp.]|uniref:TonB-dependent receptor domain-containing protein n=1 Tax=Parasphingorhabdus sp. TaxID=2709688 RepID=UPI003FA7A826